MKKNNILTIPTLFTLARIAMIPFIVIAMIQQAWGMAFFLFVCACLTDFIDGFLARLLNQKTFLGACLDPIADKLLLLSCFATLAFIQTPLCAIPHWFVLFVISREFLQIAGAIIIYCIKGHCDIQPTLLGKTTACMQMIFIMWLFFCYFFCWLPIKTYYGMLGVVILLIGASFVQYASIGLSMITTKKL